MTIPRNPKWFFTGAVAVLLASPAGCKSYAGFSGPEPGTSSPKEGGGGTGGIIGERDSGGHGTGGTIDAGGNDGSGVGIGDASGVVRTGDASEAGGVVGTSDASEAGGVVGTSDGGGEPTDPVQVVLNSPSLLNGITAASWRPDLSPPLFFLLEPAANRFWPLNPATGAVGASRPLPPGSASHAFGTSAKYAYIVINNAINRVPLDGGTAATDVVPLGDTPGAPSVSGAFAGGYFLVGESSAGAAHALSDTSKSLEPGTTLGHINRVVTDGKSFAFGTLVVNDADASLVRPVAPFEPISTPCRMGVGLGPLDNPLGVSGNTVAWVTRGGSTAVLHFGTVSGGICTAGATISSIGQVTTTANFAGLIDNEYAVVLTHATVGSADVEIRQAGTSFIRGPLQGVYFGAKFPSQIVMGPPHYAVVLSDDVPAVISF